MEHWGCADAGTIFTSVRYPLSKAAHVLQTTLAPVHAQHYEHCLAAAVAAWATESQRGMSPTGPSFDHAHYGAVIGRGGQTIRSLSPEAKLVWDAQAPLAGQYVVCVATASDAVAAKCHQLRARLDTQTIRIGLAASHPFGGGEEKTRALPPPGIVAFELRTNCSQADLGNTLLRAFTAHTDELVRGAPRANRSQWLLEAPETANVYPPFESSVVAADLYDGILTVAVARRHWQRCRALVTNALV